MSTNRLQKIRLVDRRNDTASIGAFRRHPATPQTDDFCRHVPTPRSADSSTNAMKRICWRPLLQPNLSQTIRNRSGNYPETASSVRPGIWKLGRMPPPAALPSSKSVSLTSWSLLVSLNIDQRVGSRSRLLPCCCW